MVGYGLLRNRQADDSRVVKQRTRRDCAICCISMATGLHYDRIVMEARDYYMPDIGMWNVEGTLERLGVGYKHVNKLGRRKALVRFFVKETAEGRLHHMVYWDGQKFIDPSNNGKKHHTIVRIIEIRS